jgi:L-iditol 2-dehydrogenase
MQAAVLHSVRDLRIEERPIPSVGPRDVLVRVQRVGVCGSDIHYYTHGRIGDFIVDAPMVLGHESSGIVAAVGEGVTKVKPGDRVTMEPGYTCRRCHYCKTGRYNLCPDVTFMATPPIDGAFCEYVAWPDDFVFRVPDGISLEEAALMEPLSVGLWAVKRGEVQFGHTVALFGAGPIGCVTLQAAKVAGATTIIAVDVEPYRLEMARKLGATHTVNAKQTDAVATIREITSAITGFAPARSGVDVAFETAGTTVTCRNALAATRPGGVAVLVGLPPEPMVELDIVSAASKEIDIRGQFRYANCYPPAIALVEQGRIDLKSLVTHHFALKEAEQALRFADEHKSEAMKVVVDVE